MKRFYSKYGIFFSLTMLMLIFLSACGSDETDQSEPSENESNTSEETFELKIAGIYPPEHPNTQNLMEFEKEVEEKSNGSIQIEVYPANQLGDYTLVYEEIMRGTIEMGLIGVPTQFDPDLGINWINYTAQSYEQAREVFSPDSFFFQANEEIHSRLGVKFLALHAEGFTGVGAVKEITAQTEPGAEKGILLRVPPVEIFKSSLEDLGFRTVSVPYAELYQALQTGVADGWAGGGPVPNYHDVGDVINYFYDYYNWFETTHLLMNNDFWNKIGETNQKVIQEAANGLYLRSMENAEANDKEYKEMLAQEKGVTIVELSDEELTNLANHIRETNWPKLTNEIDKELIDGLLESYK